MAKAALNKKMAPFHQQNGIKFREETGKLVHLEYSFVWCRYLHASESRSEMPGKY